MVAGPQRPSGEELLSVKFYGFLTSTSWDADQERLKKCRSWRYAGHSKSQMVCQETKRMFLEERRTILWCECHAETRHAVSSPWRLWMYRNSRKVYRNLFSLIKPNIAQDSLAMERTPLPDTLIFKSYLVPIICQAPSWWSKREQVCSLWSLHI